MMPVSMLLKSCDAAGKLADGVHLLRVAQLFLCPAALLDFDGQLVERLLQCLGSQLDLLLELLIELAQHLSLRLSASTSMITTAAPIGCLVLS